MAGENPAALDDEQIVTAASASTAEPAEAESSAPAADFSKELRDLKAQLGRELADERRNRSAAEQQVVQMSQEVQSLRQYMAQMGEALTRQQQAQMQDYLNRLPPDKRVVAELDLLKRQQQQLLAQRQQPTQQSTAPRQYTEQERRDYQQRRIQEILSEHNAGLPDTLHLKGDEEELDTTSEDAFKASARALAKIRAKEAQMAEKKTPPKAAASEDEIEQRILARLGVGSPTAAKPKGGAKVQLGDVTGAIQKVQTGYKSKGGNRAQLDQLKAIRDSLRAG